MSRMGCKSLNDTRAASHTVKHSHARTDECKDPLLILDLSSAITTRFQALSCISISCASTADNYL